MAQPQLCDLASAEFGAHPQQVYERLRREFGPVAPVRFGDRQAAVVLGHQSAREVLADRSRFPAQPSDPEQSVPLCPGAALLRRRHDGEDPRAGWARDRSLLNRVDQNRVRARTIELAEARVNGFVGDGHADLVGQFAVPVCCEVIGQMVGIDSIGAAIAQVFAMRSPSDRAARSAAHGLVGVVAESVPARRAEPREDLVSWLCAQIDDDGVVAARAARIFEAAAEPTWNLLARTLLRLAGDPDFGSTVVGGPLPYRDTVDEVLYAGPPVDLLLTYPRAAMAIGDVWLPPDQPLAVSLSAANNDPAIAGENGDRSGNRAHLAWGSGERSCPAQELALLIVINALERLLDTIPDITLAADPRQLRFDAAAGHRALASLPVRFTPTYQIPLSQ
ncbi:hypothetical protein ACTD5D_40495 [Nocardia takedensis]|uniref:hypothetical protein n=1 Tax=Nocardia takedensis TaxID=259390 RepID=UPI003F77274C